MISESKIDLVNIEGTEESSEQSLKLSEIYWRDYLEDQDYNKDVSKMCELCIAEQIEKYGAQTIPCSGLLTPEQQLGELWDGMKGSATPETLATYRALYNAYDFMDMYCDTDNIGKDTRAFVGRWYQKQLLGCSARSKVVRMGRRCIPGYEKILQTDGTTVEIANIEVGTSIVSYRDGSIAYNRIIDKWCNGIKPVYRITLSDGKTVDCTSNHPVLVIDSVGNTTWKSLDDGLRVSETIVILNETTDASEQFLKSSITAITYLTDMETFDITVEKDHNFIVNGIVTHNTGKTMSLAMQIIFKCMTDRGNKKLGHRALLVSPFQNQTEEVVDNIKKLCSVLDENPILNSKASPVHAITFKNGSVLKGFTAATNGDSIRGQPADSIWLDEVDDIPSKAMTSISGIFMDNPDVEIWRSGTPKGEFNLYNSSLDPQTKEFHFPSFVIPHYDDDIDKQIRSDMDEVGYIQEAMALYGVSAHGIFDLTFIERAQAKPKYIRAIDVLEQRNSFIVIIGVDWNHDQVGTRIVVTAYDKNDPQFYIIDKERVAVEGWTQQAAMEKIIQLNRKYNCDHIFVDSGFGSTQIGDLKLYGEMQVGKVVKGHPDLKLMDIEAVDFGSTIEVKDRLSGESRKQGAKQFIVQNAVLILEKDLLALDGKKDIDVVKQLKNYIQKSRNKGKVTYGYVSKKIGDHDLDALMIALYGYKKLYSSVLGGAFEGAMLRFGSGFSKTSDSTTIVDETFIDPRISIKFGGSKKQLAKPPKSMVSLYSRSHTRSKPHYR